MNQFLNQNNEYLENLKSGLFNEKKTYFTPGVRVEWNWRFFAIL